MCQVFKKSPEKHAAQKSKDDPACCKPNRTTVVKHINHYRGVHSPDHQWVCLGQHFKIGVLKKLRLALVMDFLELHRPKDKES